MNRSNERTLLLGALVTLLGLVLLLSTLGVLAIDSRAMWGIMLSLSAGVFAICYARDHEQWWALVVACVLALIALEVLLPPLSRAQRRLLWGAATCGAGLAFVAAFLRHRQQWWWLIPGGTLLTIGTTALLKSGHLLPGRYRGAVFFAGLGLTFGAIALLGRGDGRVRWAQYPALSLLAVSALLLLAHSPWTGELLVPLCLLALGLFIVVRNLRRLRAHEQPPSQETP